MNCAICYDKDFFPNELWMKDINTIKLSRFFDNIPENCDCVILPYGSYYPCHLYSQLKDLLSKGGTIIVLGNRPFGSPCEKNQQNSWVPIDVCNFGERWRYSFGAVERNKFGIGFAAVPLNNILCPGKMQIEIADEFKTLFEKKNYFCKFYGKGYPVGYGRCRTIASAVVSTSNIINEMITISDYGKGRIVSVGIGLDDDYSHADFINGIIRSVDFDENKKLKFQPELPLIARTDENIIAKQPLTINNIKVEANKSLPNLGVGRYEVNFGADCKGFFSFIPAKEMPKSKVYRKNSYPVFEIDNEVFPLHLYSFNPYDLAIDYLVSSFAKISMNIYNFQLPPALCWLGDDKYDWSVFDMFAERILNSNPNAKFFPRIYLNSPVWWDEQNESELKVFRNGKKYFENTSDNPADRYSKYSALAIKDKTTVASWFSEKWRNDTAKMLKALLEHIKTSRYRSAFVGCFLANGLYGEWININGEDLSEHCLNTYKTTNCPDYDERQVNDYGLFRDYKKREDVIKYYRKLKVHGHDALNFFNQELKKITPEQASGTFTGYLVKEYLLDQDLEYFHFGFYKNFLKNNNAPELACSPYHYLNRNNAPESDCNLGSVTGSYVLNNKIFMSENDQRTCLCGKSDFGLHVAGDCNLEMADESLKKNFLNAMVHNCALWWYDFGEGWYEHPKLMETISRLHEIFYTLIDDNYPKNLSPKNKINILYSTSAYDFITATSPICRLNTGVQLQHYINRYGFPWEIYFLEDITNIPKQKVWLFMNTYSLTKEQTQQIENLKKDGNILIFLYAPSLYVDDEISLENSSKITGINLNWSFSKVKPSIFIDGKEELQIPYYNALLDRPFAPEIYANDNDAEILAINNYSSNPSIAVKDFGSWKSAYISSPICPNTIINKILKKFGETPLLDTQDALYSNDYFVGFSALNDGIRIINTPFDIEDLFENKVYKSSNNKVSIPSNAGQTFFGKFLH